MQGNGEAMDTIRYFGCLWVCRYQLRQVKIAELFEMDVMCIGTHGTVCAWPRWCSLGQGHGMHHDQGHACALPVDLGSA